ncbi:MAG: hypothetical protein WCO02_11585 [Bacteroidota bacterium]
MKKLLTLITVMLFIIIPLLTVADPPGPPTGGGGTGGGGGTPVGAPIDGGLGILLAMGAAYGGKKLYKARKDKKEKENESVAVEDQADLL